MAIIVTHPPAACRVSPVVRSDSSPTTMIVGVASHLLAHRSGPALQIGIERRTARNVPERNAKAGKYLHLCVCTTARSNLTHHANALYGDNVGRHSLPTALHLGTICK